MLADDLGSGDVGSGDFQMGKLLGVSRRPLSCPWGSPRGPISRAAGLEGSLGLP